MKMVLFFILLGGLAAAGQALYAPPPQNWHAANQSLLCQNPYRKIGDKCCYLGKLFDWARMNSDAPKPMSWEVINWKIQTGGIQDDALILAPAWNESSLCALKHYPAASNLVDGQIVVCFAFKIGTYRWGTLTIPAYDYGVIPTDDEIQRFLKPYGLDRETVAEKQKSALIEAARQKAIKDAETKKRVEAFNRAQATNGLPDASAKTNSP
jgi:hypothetical protein